MNPATPRKIKEAANILWGNVLRGQKRDDKASEKYNEASEQYTKDAYPNIALGDMLLSEGKDEEAKAQYRKAISS